MSENTQSRRRPLQKRDSIAQFATTLSADQLKELKSLFALLDKDGDGQLTGSELEAMFAELGVRTSPAEVLRLTKELDKDGDGRVSFKEFIEGITWMKKSSVFNKTSESTQSTAPVSHTSAPKRPSHQRSASVMNFIRSLDNSKVQRVKELFDLADSDHDGVITKPEFYKLCQTLQIDISKQQFEVLFSNLDTSSNGQIEFGEFLSGMRWLEKGASLNATSGASESTGDDQDTDDSEVLVQELKQKNTVLKNILKETLMKGLATARTKLKQQDVASAKTVLEILDVDFILDVQDIIGTLLSDKEVGVYRKMKEFVKQNE
eukprot:TRINITY_DN99_c0_g1_i2.p1 TRINITY_DN99_c0_g1~~TRINITY_DN99_c0_g1_i2.p1  ORF type:complete len:337 (-),score=42.05 TRINITY_DN99_c0_g1_i2:709-1665(-)